LKAKIENKGRNENHLDNQPQRRNLNRMKAISELAKDALELPPVQRLALARILLDLSDENQDFSPAVEAAWEKEICRRMAEVKAGRAHSSGFDQVFARLDQRFSG
jgi:putative addiction module component (TIGR02574 family)